jgi:hypothetical protein
MGTPGVLCVGFANYWRVRGRPLFLRMMTGGVTAGCPCCEFGHRSLLAVSWYRQVTWAQIRWEESQWNLHNDNVHFRID